jgi:hypothetical protein
MSEVKRSIEEIFEDGRAIDEALKEAARDARRFHKAIGNPMATWADGRVVWVQPEDIVVDDDDRAGEGEPAE